VPNTEDKGIWKISFCQDPKESIQRKNYERYIGTVQRLEPNLPEFCDVNLTSDFDEEGQFVIYDPLMYVLKGTGLMWVDNFRMNTGMVDTAPLIIWLL
jgi:hypothetical protein